MQTKIAIEKERALIDQKKLEARHAYAEAAKQASARRKIEQAEEKRRGFEEREKQSTFFLSNMVSTQSYLFRLFITLIIIIFSRVNKISSNSFAILEEWVETLVVLGIVLPILVV